MVTGGNNSSSGTSGNSAGAGTSEASGSSETATTETAAGLTYMLTLRQNDEELYTLKLEDVTPQGPLDNKDKGFRVNCKTHLIEGLDEDGNKTGHLYNKFITTGSFFSAPVGLSKLISNVTCAAARYTPLYY